MSVGKGNTYQLLYKNFKRFLAQRETNHLHIEHQNHMKRRLQTLRNVHYIKGKTIIISNQQRIRKLGLGCWTFTTLLGRNNNKTTIFNVHRPINTAVELVGNSTLIKQQWIILNQLNRKGHPHDVIINDLIQAIKEKQITITK